MLEHGCAVTPVFDENQTQRIFHINVDRMEISAIIGARPDYMRQAGCAKSIECLGASDDAAGDNDHCCSDAEDTFHT